MRLIKSFWFSWAWMLLVLILCLISGNSFPKTNLSFIPHFDKIVHFGFYLVLSYLITNSLLIYRQTNKLKAITAVYLLILCASYGLSIEIMQGWLKNGRSSDMYDMVANLAGIVAGLFINEPFNRKIVKTRFVGLFKPFLPEFYQS